MEIKRKNHPQKDDRIRDLQFVLGKILDIILLIVSVFFLGIGLYAILDSQLVIRRAEIPESLKKDASRDKEYPSIEELQKVNPDIVAWLSLDDTPVDYPITKSSDNTKYLARDYKNEYSMAGNPFVDFRNDFLNDDFTVIYGHRMNQQKMFGVLVSYADNGFLKEHTTGTITTTEGTYNLEVLLYSVEKIADTKIYNLAEVRNDSNGELLNALSNNAVAINNEYSKTDLKDVNQTKDWKLLLLSTCDKNSKHYRDVLLLRIGDKV